MSIYAGVHSRISGVQLMIESIEIYRSKGNHDRPPSPVFLDILCVYIEPLASYHEASLFV
jgi:hypothetical protein